MAHFFERLASFSRLILFDKRGTGLSDRVAAAATLEQRMDDVRAVMDAVGSERAAVFGVPKAEHGILFAATYPSAPRPVICGASPAPLGAGLPVGATRRSGAGDEQVERELGRRRWLAGLPPAAIARGSAELVARTTAPRASPGARWP